MIFFQTEYERRGEVIVDFNDLLWNNCSKCQFWDKLSYSKIFKFNTFLVAHNGSIENQNLKDQSIEWSLFIAIYKTEDILELKKLKGYGQNLN